MAEHAEAHIEDEDAPLFLRFVNLLINDAIFLLDEALGFMKQIQEQQLDRERNWGNLTTRERDQREGELMHLGRLAKYHNLMGTETIQMLDRLSGAMSAVFTHDTMVDRIASMLNYFLKNLVGPNRKSFKVKNIEDFAFRPGEIVADITKIYINFKKCSTFLSAVSRDGRSYTPELFDQTEEVLFKVGKAELVTEVSKSNSLPMTFLMLLSSLFSLEKLPEVSERMRTAKRRMTSCSRTLRIASWTRSCPT